MVYIVQYFNELFHLVNEMAPYLLLGFLFAGILHLVFQSPYVNKYIGKRNTRSVINASLLGVPLPLCSCGVIPTGVSFYKNGAAKGPSVSFLISTPQTGVDSILATYSMLGLPFAILRPVVALITGTLGGIFTNLFTKHEPHSPPRAKNQTLQSNKPSVKSMMKYAFVEFMQDIVVWLVIGFFLAALISVLVPEDFFHEYIGSNFISMLIILIAAIPLYVCATGSIPVAAVLMLKGLSPGAALVFLMAGPATNIATMTVLGKVFGKKTLIIYLLTIIGGALIFGALTDIFIPAKLFTDYLVPGHAAHQHLLPGWLHIGSSVIIGFLITYNLYLKYKDSLFKSSHKEVENAEAEENSGIIQLRVEGMNCNKCKANVETHLKEIDDIKFVEANPVTSIVKVKGGSLNMSEIQSVVESIGYKYKGILK